MKQAIATVISNKMILPGGPHRAGRALASNLMWLHCPDIARRAKPGQFIMVCCADLTLSRPFSIHQVNKDNIALFFAVLEGGKGSQWLAERKKGNPIELTILRPLGNSFSILPDSKNLLLVAGGIGIAPLRFLADEVIRRGKEVTLLLGAPAAPQLYPPKLLPAGVKLVTTTEDGSGGRKGMITDVLPDFINGADQVFACGPLAMYRAMARMPELRNKPVQVSLEMRMGCGLGICYGCTVKTRNGLRQTCKDGPVFDMRDIIWDEMADV